MITRKFPIVSKLLKINSFVHVINLQLPATLAMEELNSEFYGSTSVFLADLKQWQNRVGFSLLHHV